jgi:hypothetical protein
MWRKAWLAIMIVMAVPISASFAHGQAVEWTRQFDTSGFDAAYGVAVDATGVYVVGITEGAPGSIDAFIRKYDLNGAEQRTRKFGTGDYAAAYGVAVDATGVYVVGVTGGAVPATYDAFVCKYDSGGTPVWTQQF